jgi:hypothetical protein
MTRDDQTRDHHLAAGSEVDPDQPAHPLELALRHGSRYSGLRDVELDPRLLLYVPLDLCEREMVLPLTVTEDALQLATAYPDPDIELIVERFPDLAIELVFAPIERIGELLDLLSEGL